MTEAEVKKIEAFQQRGFPRFNAAEFELIGRTNVQAALGAGRVVGYQHFPGGGPEIENTEDQPQTFNDGGRLVQQADAQRGLS